MLPKVWPAVLALGWICLAVGAAQGVMALFSLAVGDGMAEVFGATSAITIVFGGACVLTTGGRHFELRFRDAALLTVVSWFVVPAFAALPLLAEPVDLSVVDAYFEFVSGMTTTGSTVMIGLDTMPPSILLWRSTGQWIGGIGIIGLAIVILPFLKVGGMQLFRLESSDRSEKGMPRTREIAAAVGRVYVILTLACFMSYWLLGMSAFDALNHALTTLPTAGFSTHDTSFGYFNSPAIEWAGDHLHVPRRPALPRLPAVRAARVAMGQDRAADTDVSHRGHGPHHRLRLVDKRSARRAARDGAHEDRVQHDVGGDDHRLRVDRLPAMGRRSPRRGSSC